MEELYIRLLKLNPRYRRIDEVPLSIRLRQSPTRLKDWIHRIEHQIQMTSLLANVTIPGQLTIQQAIRNMHRANGEQNKYPP